MAGRAYYYCQNMSYIHPCVLPVMTYGGVTWTLVAGWWFIEIFSCIRDSVVIVILMRIEEERFLRGDYNWKTQCRMCTGSLGKRNLQRVLPTYIRETINMSSIGQLWVNDDVSQIKITWNYLIFLGISGTSVRECAIYSVSHTFIDFPMKAEIVNIVLSTVSFTSVPSNEQYLAYE